MKFNSLQRSVKGLKGVEFKRFFPAGLFQVYLNRVSFGSIILEM
jgi:hypothetical protein